MRMWCRLLCLLVGSAILSITPAWADDTPHAVSIPAGDLKPALELLMKQTGVELVYRPEQVSGLKTQGAKGTLLAEQAVATLLAGTPLVLNKDASGALLIAPQARDANDPPDIAKQSPNDKADKEGKKRSSQDFRVAQVDQTAVGSQVGQGTDEEKKKYVLQEIVVTGSRIPTTAGNEVLPVRSYTRKDIETSGQTTLGEFLNTLPDVSSFSNGIFQLGIPGAQTVQLHGLPVGTTLTLLDGQRLQTNLSGFFDLSNIPLAAVERVEILPVGASAVYGADGLGGAVNTILRKNFNGFEANAALDLASNVTNPSVNLAWGKSSESGSISLIGSYQERGALLGTQREPWSLTSLPAGVPALAISALAMNVCAPGNVYSVDGSNLPGLSSPEAGIPAGIAGTPTIGQFVPTAGKQNVCSIDRYADVTPWSRREGALLSAHYAIAQSADLFAEVLFSNQTLRYLGAPQIQFEGTVGANNPYNPFGEAVNVTFAYPGTGTVEDQSMSFIRPIIGVRGSLFSDWHYEVSAFFSQDRTHLSGLQTDYQLTVNALNSSDPATALNPFASPPGSPQLLSSLVDPAVDSFSEAFDDRTINGQAILRGPLLQLPAGALQVVIGSEYSQERQDSTFTGSPPLLLGRNSSAVFTEARIPLLAGNERSPGDARVALTLAGRYDHSSDYGGQATWQGGLLWHVSQTLSFRGAYGLSYQAPTLSEISGPQATSVGVTGIGVSDPFRGNEPVVYPVTLVTGPNFNLKPETGNAFTLGLEYSSQALPGLHSSLLWYDLTIRDYIGVESFQDLVAYPDLFPGAVVRAPPTVQDQQQGFLGLITQINDEFYNYGDIRVAGVDADLSYAIDTRLGRFTPSVSIAYVYKWQSALLPNTPEVHALGVATDSAVGGGVGWSPRLKGTAALAWKQGSLSMNLAGRYISRYLDYQSSLPNTNELGNYWIFDFNSRYEAGQAWAGANSWLAGSYVSFGAVNLFNKPPQFSYTPALYDIQEYDLRGRYFTLGVGVRF